MGTTIRTLMSHYGFRGCGSGPLFLQRRGAVHLSRKVVRVHDSLAKSKAKSKSGLLEDKELGALRQSTSLFNLTMGEILMGKSNKRIAVEGTRLVEDAVKTGLKMEKLFVLKSMKELPPGVAEIVESQSHKGGDGEKGLEVHKVGLKAMELWSQVTTPPGIVGIFTKPTSEDQRLRIQEESQLPLTIICDNIREPGNLGSILRTASGAGCNEVFLTKGCVDPWNMKVLRGGCGAQFRIPISTDLTEPLLTRLIENKMLQCQKTGSPTPNNVNSGQKRYSFLICDSHQTDPRADEPSTLFWNVNYSNYSHHFLIIGGETEGISNDAVKMVKILSKKGLCSMYRVRIPLANDIESLNAANAFGIIVFEILRQHGISVVPEHQ